ncbi:hypothetical protein FT663_04299 [Candidozyma haemuli var. vulneris]|nr:hypothetical protein FT662_04806 [[Candida] haemuloni var. vulneris]KAF3987843.1 hypothetical protein FT663_04299 [[Candida] haemuloni var. vulneris]
MDARRPVLLLALLGLFLFSLIAQSYLYGANTGADAAECRTVSMYPSYARIRSFDESHTKFASKYSLWLYRESGKDTVPKKEGEGFQALDGIPILFIPGNAGSYRQVRSIAAETSVLWFDPNIHVVDNPKQKNYDFFAADFNEDFSAFHGRTILDQAEYLNDAVGFILSLYAHTENPPTSLILMGHSMGGIVARLMLTLPNYIPGSVNTILTLSSPHSAPPLTFDGDLLRVYSAIDRFWYDGFHPSSQEPTLAQQRLHNVSVVSLTGGLLDSILPADYTTLGYLVPPSNGFTMFTTGIPDVWTPSDHLAIVWCRQLRRSIARWLLSIADISSPHRTYPLERRMELSRQIFMTGLEKYAEQDFDKTKDAVGVTLDKNKVNFLGPNSILKFNNGRHNPRKVNVIMTEPGSTFQFLSSDTLTYWEDAMIAESQTASVLLCSKDKSPNADPENSFAGLQCVDLFTYIRRIPRSSSDVEKLMDSSFDGEKDSFYGLKIEPSILDAFDMVIIHEPLETSKSHFSIAHLASASKANVTLKSDLNSLLMSNVHAKLPADRPLSTNIYIPGAWSSVLAYKVQFKNLEKKDSEFIPFIRQWRDEPYETKWHINVKNGAETHLSVHAIAPFTPFDRTRKNKGINLELWVDPENPQTDDPLPDIEMVFSVDVWGSLRLLVLRYRLAVVAHCLAVSLLVFLFQSVRYYHTGKFPDQVYGLGCICERKLFALLVIFLGSLSYLVKNKTVQRLLNLADPVVLHHKNEINISLHPNYSLNTFYLGLEENCLWFLGPAFFVMAIGINWFIYHLLVYTGLGLVYVGRLTKLFPRTFEEKEKPFMRWRKSKIGGTIVLVVLVTFYMPYQFAYLVSSLMQIVTVVKLMAHRNAKSACNYNISIMMLMLWVLPINIPVLIVFVHNFSINWATPFSSHHNFLAVAPIVALAQLQSQYSEWVPIPRQGEGRNTYFKAVVSVLAYIVFYCMIYGVRHTYWLHHLFNFTCGLILLGYGEKVLWK